MFIKNNSLIFKDHMNLLNIHRLVNFYFNTLNYCLSNFYKFILQTKIFFTIFFKNFQKIFSKKIHLKISKSILFQYLLFKDLNLIFVKSKIY